MEPAAATAAAATPHGMTHPPTAWWYGASRSSAWPCPGTPLSSISCALSSLRPDALAWSTRKRNTCRRQRVLPPCASSCPDAANQGDSFFTGIIPDPMKAAVVELVQVTRERMKLRIFKAKRLIAIAFDLHGELSVMRGMPSAVDVRFHFAMRGDSHDQDAAELFPPDMAVDLTGE